MIVLLKITKPFLNLILLCPWKSKWIGINLSKQVPPGHTLVWNFLFGEHRDLRNKILG
jgi:hypothetical protein